MSLFDVIIVGSGPAGTFSALGLEGKKVLILDVGYQPKSSTDLSGNLDELRSKTPDMFSSLIGSEFESLHNLYKDKISYKLKAPYMSYVLKDWDKLSPVKTHGFEAMMSFASGGLANAWGAGVYQFTNDELKNFPINAADLNPYYQELTEHMGISGENDDLEESFSKVSPLLPPMRRSDLFNSFIKRYEKLKTHPKLKNIKVGSPRLAILSKDFEGRTAYQYDRMDFFKPQNPAIYNPVFTLNGLLEESPQLEYKPGFLVIKYREFDDYIETTARKLDDGSLHSFKSKKLILAAGALNTTKLVLHSNGDVRTQLPIMDNPMVCVPIVDHRYLGSKPGPYDSPIAQLNLVYNDGSSLGPVQASMYGSTGPLRTDITFGFPLSLSGNLAMTKYVAPAAGLLMVFFPGHKSPQNYIKLTSGNSLEIKYTEENIDKTVIKSMMVALRKMGYFCLKSLNQYPKIGNSLHYAGMLPMKKSPAQYETDKLGQLFNSKRVHITDGACFTELPAKNLTFTIMANALRISRTLREDLS